MSSVSGTASVQLTDQCSVLVVGAKNSGKTAFINFLRTSLALPPRKQSSRREDFVQEPVPIHTSPNFVSHYLETELSDGERVGLTIWDSEGFESTIIDLQLREIATFLETKFEETLAEELKVIRSPGARDTHIHAVFLLLDPLRLNSNLTALQKALDSQKDGQFVNGKSFVIPPSPSNGNGNVLGSLDDTLDLQVLRTLQGKTTVIPVISKADTIPQDHMIELKRSVGESLRQASLDPLENLSLEYEDDESESSEEESEEAVAAKRQMHRRHDSKKFDERDEDRLLSNQPELGEEDDRSNQSVLDLSSSSASTPMGRGGSKQDSSESVELKERGNHSLPSLFLPLSIISPWPIVEHEPGPGKVGRKFAWGFADPYEPEHCDFVRLKEAVFREWRDELRVASRELWYERWRTLRLNSAGERSSRTPGGGRRIGGTPAVGGRGPRNAVGGSSSMSASNRTSQWPLA